MATVHVPFVEDEGTAGGRDVVLVWVVLLCDCDARGVVGEEAEGVVAVYWGEVGVVGVGGVLV